VGEAEFGAGAIGAVTVGDLQFEVVRAGGEILGDESGSNHVAITAPIVTGADHGNPFAAINTVVEFGGALAVLDDEDKAVAGKIERKGGTGGVGLEGLVEVFVRRKTADNPGAGSVDRREREERDVLPMAGIEGRGQGWSGSRFRGGDFFGG